MTRPDTRRRRRGHNDTPAVNEGAPSVTLQSPEFIEKLLREYRENTKAANVAQDEAKRAFADASRREQQVGELGAKEQAALAKVQQAQAELQQVQAERQEAAGFAEKARTYGTSQMANHEGFAGQAADARTVLESFQIPIPEDAEPVGQPTHQVSAEKVDPAGPTSVDLADDPRMEGPLRRWTQAHDEHDAETGEQAAAS